MQGTSKHLMMGPMTRSKASAQRQSEQEADELHADNTTLVGHVTGTTPRRSTRHVAKIDLINHGIPIQRPTRKEVNTVEVREPLGADETNVQNDSQADMSLPTEITSPSRIFSSNSNSLRSSSLPTTHSLFPEEYDDQYNPIEDAFFQEKRIWHTEREQLQAGILSTREEMASITTDLLKKVSGLAADNEGLHRYLAEAQKQLTALGEELDQIKIKYESESKALREVLESEVQTVARLQRDLDNQVFQFHGLEGKLHSEYGNLQMHYRHIQNEFPEKLQLCVQQEVDRIRTAQGTEEMETACQLRKENAEMRRQLVQATELLWHTQNRLSLCDEINSEPNRFIDGPDSDDRNGCQTTAPADKRPSSLAKQYLEASRVGTGNSQGRPSRKKIPQKTDHGYCQPRYPRREAPEATSSRESKADSTPLYNFVNVNFGPESQVRFLGEPSGTKTIQNKRSKDSHTPTKRAAVAKKQDANQAAQSLEKPLDKYDRLQSLAISLCQGSDLFNNAVGQEGVAAEEGSDEAMDISPGP